MAKKAPGTGRGGKRPGPRVTNRRARFDFQVLEKVECGIELVGTEVKSVRGGNASLEGAYARITNGEVFLCGANIAIYPQAADGMQHDPLRERKLLLRRRQIARLEAHVLHKGRTLVPLALYFSRGWAKCELGAAVGKRKYDKRRAIQDRQQARDVARELRRR